MKLHDYVAKYHEWNFDRFCGLALLKQYPDGHRWDVVSHITITSFDDRNDYEETPCPLIGNRETMQSIFDALYNAGYRPSKAVIDETPVRDRHLQDMRRLVETAYDFKFDEVIDGKNTI